MKIERRRSAIDAEVEALARRGPVDPDAVGRALVRAADPAAAARHAVTWLERGRSLATDRAEDLVVVFGGSPALATIALSDEDAWLGATRAPPVVPATAHLEAVLAEVGPEVGNPEVRSVLRRHKRREMLRIGARDLTGSADVEDTIRELSALADGAVEVAYRHGRAVAEADYGVFPSSDELGFAVLGMGKLGGRELNYSSDVDLVYLYDGGTGETTGGRRGSVDARGFATRLAETLTKTLHDVTEDGFVFRVDLRLRPDGQNGPIVNSLATALTYYESWGQTWERAAMLKARPIAGTLLLGEKFLEEMEPFVYRRFLDFETIDEIKAMKHRVDVAHSRARLNRDVKLGPGGIREIEFVVQALQLIHAGRDARLRTRGTLDALRVLGETRRLSLRAAIDLAESYRFLRDVEHKIQIVYDRQTQQLPAAPEEFRVLARRLGLFAEGEGDEGNRLAIELEDRRRPVRSAFENLFHTESSLEPETHAAAFWRNVETLSPEELSDELRSVGFREVEAASENLRRLHDGPPSSPPSPRRRRALAQLGPLLLGEIGAASDPDAALRWMADFITAVGARSSFLALLHENPDTLRLLLGLFGSSEYLSSFFVRHPELLDSLVRADTARVDRGLDELREELDARLAAAPDFEEELDVLRRFRHEEFLRIGVNDIHGVLAPGDVGRQLSDLAEACVGGALEVARHALSSRIEHPEPRFAVLGMGKLGGRELGYNSDLDLIFVYDGGGDDLVVAEHTARLAQRLISALQLRTAEGVAYAIDTRLRPSGRAGPLVSSLAAFRAYHETSAELWERQALIRARAIAGDASLGGEIERVADRFVYGRGLDTTAAGEIARLRGRIEQELARESDARWNVKTGRGGIVDVEFVAQMLQLRHGADHPEIRRRNTEEAVEALAREGLLSSSRAEALLDGYRFLRRLEGRLRLERDQPVEALETEGARLESVARSLGISDRDAASRLLERFRATRESVRQIYDEVFGEATTTGSD